MAALAGVLTITNRTSVLRYLPALKPPEVLAERANEILRRLDYTNAVADTAFWFEHDLKALRYLTNMPAGSDRLKQLGSGRPAPLVYWHRSSTREMKPLGIDSCVTRADPPFTEPGMRRIALDGQGRLLQFDAIPQRSPVASGSTQETDWRPLFAEAGLQITNFTSVPITRTPDLYCDRVTAWASEYPGWPKNKLRVEAGSIAGKPVFFHVVGPWRDAQANNTGRSTSDNSTISTVMRIVVRAIVLIVFGAAVYLARRNLGVGRGDRTAARRVGICVFAATMVEFLCMAHSLKWVSFLDALFANAGRGFLAWLFYLAIEPYARRHWPHTLISWSRLWNGRWRDPSIGRDLLVGCFAGLIWLLLEASEFLPTWTGHQPSDPYKLGNFSLLLGGRHIAADLLSSFNTVGFLMGFFLLLLVVRVFARRDWIVIVAFTVLFSSLSLLDMKPASSWLYGASVLANVALVVIVPVRYGLLAFVVMVLSWNLLYDPLPIGSSAWWAGPALILPSLVLVVASYGCWVAMAGKPLFKDEILRT